MSFRLFIYYCAVCGGCRLRRLGAGSPGERRQPRPAGRRQGAVPGHGGGAGAGADRRLVERPHHSLRPVAAAGGGGGRRWHPGWFRGRLLRPGAVRLDAVWSAAAFRLGLHGVRRRRRHVRLLRILAANEDSSFAQRKVLRGILGGAVGGFLGGLFYLLLQAAWGGIFRGREGNFWSPSARDSWCWDCASDC